MHQIDRGHISLSLSLRKSTASSYVAKAHTHENGIFKMQPRNMQHAAKQVQSFSFSINAFNVFAISGIPIVY